MSGPEGGNGVYYLEILRGSAGPPWAWGQHVHCGRSGGLINGTASHAGYFAARAAPCCTKPLTGKLLQKGFSVRLRADFLQLVSPASDLDHFRED